MIFDLEVGLTASLLGKRQLLNIFLRVENDFSLVKRFIKFIAYVCSLRYRKVGGNVSFRLRYQYQRPEIE